MIYLNKSKNIFVSLLFSGSVNSNLYCGCCPCNKNDSTSGDGSEEKDKDKKQQEQNKNVIKDLEGVVGLTCKLENNKICLYTKVPNNDNYKFAESVEDFKGEFKYEKFKKLKINIKIQEFNIDWKDCCTIEQCIIGFKEDFQTIKDFKFLQNKIIFITPDNYLYDLSDMKIYEIGKLKDGTSYCQNFDFSNPDDLKLKDYGILSNGKYFKQIDATNVNFADENQAEYKTRFLNGE